jgi:short-subunit dehydrogenase
VIHYQNRWAVVTGASSGLGRGLAVRLALRGMSVVLTGRNRVRLDEAASEIRRAAPQVHVETVVADLATRTGVATLVTHVGSRAVEVLVNNAGFGSYGPFAESDADRENDEIAVDVTAMVAVARAFLPGMIARRSGGILNVASTIAFQPAPYQAVYGASKAFVLSFSQALWAEARTAGVAVTALCPGPTRTGFVGALGAQVSHTAIYRQLAEPESVIDDGLRALDRGRAVVVSGLRNALMAQSSRVMPREWMTLVTARLLGATGAVSRPPIVVHNEIVVPAPPDRIWDLLTDVERWPSWYRACRWVRRDASTPGAFTWKAHPVVLQSLITRSDRPHSFAFAADATGFHAERAFTLRPAADGVSTIVVSHETQVGPFPWIGRAYLGPRLHAANQRMFEDLARAASNDAAARVPYSGELALEPTWQTRSRTT